MTKDIDAGTARIIVDRCRPPTGLGPAPSTLKLVLCMIRGFGAPGQDLKISTDVLMERTCLGPRAVRTCLSTLREHGILEVVDAPAPGRATTYKVHYERLADWMNPVDRARYVGEDPPERPQDTHPNGGTTRRRTEASGAAERRQHAPPSESTAAPHAATAAPESVKAASGAADLKERAEVPEESGSSSSAAAAAGAHGSEEAEARSRDDLEHLANRAGLKPVVAAQCATAIAAKCPDADTERILASLELVAERLAQGCVKSPTGFALTLIQAEHEPEPALATAKRRRSEQRSRARRELDEWVIAKLQGMALRQRSELARRVIMTLEARGEFKHEARHSIGESGFVYPIDSDELRPAREYIGTHWGMLTSFSLNLPAVPRGQAS